MSCPLFSRPRTTISPLDFVVFQFYSIPCEVLHPFPLPWLLGENHGCSGVAGNNFCSLFEVFTQCSDKTFRWLPKAPRWLRKSIVQMALKMVWSISCWCSSNKLLLLHAKLTETNKLSAPSPPWTELLLGGVLVTWYRRLLPSVLQRSSLSLFEFTVGVIPVSPSKSRRLLPIPADTEVRNLDGAELGCRAGWITPHTAGQGSFTAEFPLLWWCLITGAHSTQPSIHRHLPGGQKTTLKRAWFRVWCQLHNQPVTGDVRLSLHLSLPNMKQMSSLNEPFAN